MSFLGILEVDLQPTSLDLGSTGLNSIIVS